MYKENPNNFNENIWMNEEVPHLNKFIHIFMPLMHFTYQFEVSVENLMRTYAKVVWRSEIQNTKIKLLKDSKVV